MLSHGQLSDRGMPRTKASLSHLQLSDFEGCLARKLCFRIFHFHFLRDVSHQMRFRQLARARKAEFCQTKRALGRSAATVSEHVQLYRDHDRIGCAAELPVQASPCTT